MVASADTSAVVDALIVERYRQMSPAEKLQIVADLHRASGEMALAGLRQRYPGANTRELMVRLAALRYDARSMVSAFGWDPRVEGL